MPINEAVAHDPQSIDVGPGAANGLAINSRGTAMNTSTTTHLTLEQPGTEPHNSLIDLLNATRAGDKKAWDALVDRFLPLVTSVIAKYRLQASDADDVNQTVWLRVVERLDDLRDPRAFPGWLAAITRNESLRIIRLRGRATPVDPQWAPWEQPGQEPELDSDLIREERAIALREAMLDLAPQRRELLRLLMVDPPISYDKISIMLGIPRGSIGPTRARILDTLRNHLALQDLASPARSMGPVRQ
jgi:RNA polymerase sigma factor (sigma-70 family)